MLDKIFGFMLQAKRASQHSTCLKRKIGVAIPYVAEETMWGYNGAAKPCKVCERETCPATHAEVVAINTFISTNTMHTLTTLYIWAEIPCRQCLSYIKRYSSIRQIFCLNRESYGKEYPSVLSRKDEINQRKEYAQAIGIRITELDREEILEHELYLSASDDVQPN